ncbi:hypothetical protein Chor_014000, partial [Crotalus horridus]
SAQYHHQPNPKRDPPPSFAPQAENGSLYRGAPKVIETLGWLDRCHLMESKRGGRKVFIGNYKWAEVYGRREDVCASVSFQYYDLKAEETLDYPVQMGTTRFIPAVTQHAPYFKGTAVVDGDFREVSLDDFKGKYLVLFFYPLDFTFVCPTEIIAFSDKANEFHDVNCEVVAVSVDSHFCHLAWINTPRKTGGLGHMNIPLLSDLTKQISRDYGVLIESSGLALRGLFIIDPNGIIKHLSVNDLPVGRSVEETLRLVKAFQYVETHGEVCPANWIPDSPTIKPNPEDSKEYFAKVNK